jgi:hypothetical protein
MSYYRDGVQIDAILQEDGRTVVAFRYDEDEDGETIAEYSTVLAVMPVAISEEVFESLRLQWEESAHSHQEGWRPW